MSENEMSIIKLLFHFSPQRQPDIIACENGISTSFKDMYPVL